MLPSDSRTGSTVVYTPFAAYSVSTASTMASGADNQGTGCQSGPTTSVSPATSAAVAALTAAAAASAGISPSAKDSRWLTLEVCRQYQRNQCSRDENECKFAHPPTHVDVQNGRVVCCYDSIKGKCQRRDPPCKYLHPPQHLREQLMQNGRNNMIFRNMQLQLFQQQLIARSGGVLPFNPPSAIACATAACNSPGSNSSSLASNPNSLLYAGSAPLTLGTSAPTNAYSFLNIGFPPYLGALTNGTHGVPHPLPIPVGTDVIPTDVNTSPTKRDVLAEGKTTLPLYLPRTNGTMANGAFGRKLGNHETSGSCVMVVNGNSVDSMKELNGTSNSTSMRCATGGTLTGAATLFALHHPGTSALLNLPPPHQPTHTITPLATAPLAAVVNGGSALGPNHYPTLAEHAGYFQPAYHIELPPYQYN